MRHLLGISSCSRWFIFKGDEGGGGDEPIELLGEVDALKRIPNAVPTEHRGANTATDDLTDEGRGKHQPPDGEIGRASCRERV